VFPAHALETAVEFCYQELESMVQKNRFGQSKIANLQNFIGRITQDLPNSDAGGSGMDSIMHRMKRYMAEDIRHGMAQPRRR
jgi:hypothetical protein